MREHLDEQPPAKQAVTEKAGGFEVIHFLLNSIFLSLGVWSEKITAQALFSENGDTIYL